MIQQEQWDSFIKRIKSGLTNRDALLSVGISEETLYKRLRIKNPNEKEKAFIELVKKAQIEFKLKHIENISKKGDEQWQASAWLLERKFKKEFGKYEIVVEGDKEYLQNEDELLKELEKLEKEEDEHRKRKETD